MKVFYHAFDVPYLFYKLFCNSSVHSLGIQYIQLFIDNVVHYSYLINWPICVYFITLVVILKSRS